MQEHITRTDRPIIAPLARVSVTLVAPLVVSTVHILVELVDDGDGVLAAERQPLILAVANSVVAFTRIDVTGIEIQSLSNGYKLRQAETADDAIMRSADTDAQ